MKAKYSARCYSSVIILILFVCALFSNQVNAQQKGFRGGIMAGACASQVDGDKLSGYNKGGFQGGIFLSNKLNDKSGFSIEMKYIQKGSRTTSSPPDSVNVTPDRYYKLRLSYIEVPFLANYYLKKKFMLESGLGFAYLFRVREDTDGNGMTTLGKYDIPFKHFDFPFYFGVAFCPFENFHINFRYSYSTMAIRNHPGNQTWYFDRGQYNNLLSFGVYLNL